MAAPNQTRFYQPLRSLNSIRLLRRAVSGSGVPQFWLEEHEIPTCPSFVAISYTWSPPYLQHRSDNGTGIVLDFTTPLSINCELFQATQNMVDALRCALRESELDYFWMDQCCINQTSSSEKAHQVNIMDKIYETADMVIIWLGGYHDFSKSFQWMTGEFASVVESKLEVTERRILHTADSTVIARLVNLSTEEYEKRFYEAECFYSLCRYFQRIWVRQEVVFARQIRMFCGDLEIVTEGLLVLYMCFNHTNWHEYIQRRHAREDTNRYVTFAAFGWWTCLRHAFSRGTSSMLLGHIEGFLPFTTQKSTTALSWLGLWHIISLLQYSECSDPRDKIYAALPFATRVLKPFASELTIRPDYDISPERLYIKFCATIIRETGVLTVLAHVDDISQRRLNLPSWVKDFSSPTTHSTAKWFSGEQYQDRVASMGLRHKVTIRNDRLSSYGCRFTTISKRTDNPGNGLSVDYVPSLLALIVDSPAYIDHVPRLQALWETLFCNNCWGEGTFQTAVAQHFRGPAQSKTKYWFYTWLVHQLAMGGMHRLHKGESFEQWTSYLASLMSSFRNDIPDWNLFIDRTNMLALAYYDGQRPSDVELLREIRDACAVFEGIFGDGGSRPLFMTEEGFIGNGPIDLQTGDEVWFVHSCAVPLVFRPRDEVGTYTLIGGCYLHGFMHDTHVFDPGYDFVKKWQKFTLV